MDRCEINFIEKAAMRLAANLLDSKSFEGFLKLFHFPGTRKRQLLVGMEPLWLDKLLNPKNHFLKLPIQ